MGYMHNSLADISIIISYLCGLQAVRNQNLNQALWEKLDFSDKIILLAVRLPAAQMGFRWREEHVLRILMSIFLSYKGKSERLYNHQLLGLLRRPRRRSDKIGKRLFRCRMIYIFQKGLVCPNRFSSSCLINF